MILHNAEDECPNCGETVYFEFDDGSENEEDRQEEVYGVCENCDTDYIINIYYDSFGNVQHWSIS
jgi:hypothetical protein